jgi:hypothetical protein
VVVDDRDIMMIPQRRGSIRPPQGIKSEGDRIVLQLGVREQWYSLRQKRGSDNQSSAVVVTAEAGDKSSDRLLTR